jgi:hypothetical protein
MLAKLWSRMRRRMALYKPKRFRDHYEYAAFFDARNIVLAGDDMAVLEYPNEEVQQKIFRHAVEKFDLTEQNDFRRRLRPGISQKISRRPGRAVSLVFGGRSEREDGCWSSKALWPIF